MRTNNYLWAMLAAATLTLTGCGSDENGIAEPQLQEKTAQLELRLTGSGVNTKATGSALPTQAEENTLKRFTVAIFNSDNSVNAIQTITTNMTSATTINCTPAAGCTGIVVANAPTDNYFAGVLNKTDYWFYILPNEETTHTALVLEGTFKKNASDAGSTIYYPIIVNKNQAGTNITGTAGTGTSNITRNNTYAIKATIKNIGTTDPMGDITPTSLELTVNVATWALNITQDVTFD